MTYLSRSARVLRHVYESRSAELKIRSKDKSKSRLLMRNTLKNVKSKKIKRGLNLCRLFRKRRANKN